MNSNPDHRIVAVDAQEIDIPLSVPFAIVQGEISVARNIFVRVTLANGVKGYGECAPFPEVTGEDRPTTMRAIDGLRDILLDNPVAAYRLISRRMTDADREHPAARCGLEMAVLDALCRALGVPMWQFFGGDSSQICQTDITIPMLGESRCTELADRWYERGFRILKVKVGRDLDTDLARIQAIASKYSDISFVIDANQGFSEGQVVSFINFLNRKRINVRLLEQPIHKSDLSGMLNIRRKADFPICADETVANARDAIRVIQANAVDVVNIKIMKCGVIEALDIATLVRSFGLGVMFGGMVETRLAMGCSLAIAMGYGPAHTLDLDTPLLMSSDPLTGGYHYDGPMMHHSDLPGLGMEPADPAAFQN
jgi:L-alanine-DL-glutamate epimerase-like enolase superfamily enzyme